MKSNSKGGYMKLQVLDLPIRIVNEDENLLVVDKPPSMPVHACGQYNINTIMGQLRQNKMADKELRGGPFKHFLEKFPNSKMANKDFEGWVCMIFCSCKNFMKLSRKFSFFAKGI